MIAVGTDIIAVERVEEVWRRHGPRFARRVLTPAERQRCEAAAMPWRYLAKRFAAKEAIAKCLGCGIGVRLSFQDIHIERNSAGAPVVELNERALRVAAELGGSRVLLSISDERDYAVAFAALVA